MSLKRTNQGTLRLRAALAATTAILSTLALAEERGTAKPQGSGQQSAINAPSDTIALEPIDVESGAQGNGEAGSGNGGGGSANDPRGPYVAETTSVATKTATPIIEIPQAVSVVTRQQMDERNVQTLTEALTYTPGVQIGVFGFDPRFDSFFIRGFDITYTGIYRDGLRQPAGTFSIFKTEPYGLQNITVIKGPNSALYGIGSPGGLIDLTTKRPTSSPLHEVQLQFGNYNRIQGQFDLGGPIDPAGEFSYRLTGLFRDSGTQLIGVKDNRDYIAPAFTWNPDEATSFTILSEFLYNLSAGNPGFYNTPEGQLTTIFAGDPAFNNFSQSQGRIGYAFEHRFDETFTVRQNMRYALVDSDLKYTDISFVDFATGIASRYTGRILDNFSSLSLDNQLLARFATGPVNHLALVGTDYTLAGFNERMGFGSAPDLYVGAVNPAYGAYFIANPAYTINTDQFQSDIGAYLQDQANWGPFYLAVGARNDWVWTKTSDEVAFTEIAQSDQAFSGRAGLSYVSPIGLAPYVNYATAFAPTIGTNALGEPFKPITGEQKEVGIKYQPPGLNTLITASLFDITQNNSLVPDPDNFAFQIQIGKIRSRGFELQGVANPAPGLNVLLAYTALDQRILNGEPGTIGKAPSGIPAQSFAVWADYTLQWDSICPGLGAGYGMRFIGQSYGNDQNTIINNQTTLFDAALHYDFGYLDPDLAGLRFQVNATNLFNRPYQTTQAGFGYWGQLRTVIASLRFRW